MNSRCNKTGDSGILFFIIVFLLLFYDSRPIGMLAKRCREYGVGDSSILFFIIIFLLLFY